MLRLPPQTVGSYKPPQPPSTSNRETGNHLDVPPPAPGPVDPNNESSLDISLPTTVAVESPHSAAPSPLMVHGLHNSEDAPHDGTMPTLSPQPLGAGGVKSEKNEKQGMTATEGVTVNGAATSVDGSGLSVKSGAALLADASIKLEGKIIIVYFVF